MAVVQQDTLSGALSVYLDRYLDALASNSRRDIERFSRNWNKINSYYDIVNAASGENETDRAQEALDAIIEILEAEGIYIDAEVVFTTSYAIFNIPTSIDIPTDSNGSTVSLDNAYSDIFVTEQNVETTEDWTFTILAEENVTATITDNRVEITSITANEGTVTVECSKPTFSPIEITIPVTRDVGSSPKGGDVGQILAKATTEDFITEWVEGILAETNRIRLDTDVVYGTSTGIRWGTGSSGMYESDESVLVISADNLNTTGLVNGRDMIADGEKLDSLDNVVVVPGFFDLIWLSGDVEPTYTSFYKAILNDQGTTGTLILSESCDDNEKKALPSDHLSGITPIDETFAKGTYEGQIQYVVDDDVANEKITVEVYRSQADGTVVDSGITSEPVGDLGVRPYTVLESGVLNSPAGTTQFVTVLGVLAEDSVIPAGERTRIHILVEKVGVAGGVITFDVYFGADNQSYLKIPQRIGLNELEDVDVDGATTGDMFFYDSDGIWKNTSSIKVDTNKVTVSPLGAVGLSTGYFLGDGDTHISEVLDDELVIITDSVERMRIKTDVVALNGAIQLGDTTATDDGLLRFTGTDFQGRVGGEWNTFGAVITSDFTTTVDGITIPAGTLITAGTPLEQLWRDELAPYVEPSFTSFSVSLSPSSSAYEVGETVLVNSATVGANNDSEGNPPQNIFISGVGFNKAGSVGTTAADPSSTVQKTTNTSESWSVSGEDKDGNSIPGKNFSKSWQYKTYFGGNATELNSGSTDSEVQAVVDALQNNALRSGRSRSVTCASYNQSLGNFTYYVYAGKFGNLSSIILNGASPVLGAFTQLGPFTIVNGQGENVGVYVYKSNADGAFASGDTLDFS